jgi:hypothetical protein
MRYSVFTAVYCDLLAARTTVIQISLYHGQGVKLNKAKIQNKIPKFVPRVHTFAGVSHEYP